MIDILSSINIVIPSILVMATSLCNNCNVRPPNIGYKWCDRCYQKSQISRVKCLRCGNPPNPGHPLCEICYRNETNPDRNNCLMCNVTPAEPNMDLCQGCWGSLNNTAGPMSLPSSIPTHYPFPPTIQPRSMYPPLLHTVSTVLCLKCKLNAKNPGYPLCERCYQRDRIAAPRPNQFYLNGSTRPAMPFNMHPYFSQMTPMNYISQPGFHMNGSQPGFRMNYDSQSDFQSIDSTPDSQDKDAKTLLNMGSTCVNKKVMKEKPPQPTETTANHCMCPLCYSDTSRTDLFYCVHCFDSVVVGNDICNGCKMKIK